MKKKSLIIMRQDQIDSIYSPAERAQIENLTELIGPPLAGEEVVDHLPLLEEAEVIFSGWGMCPVDDEFLASAPHLEALFYGAGSVQSFATPPLFDRGIILTSAWQANAVPVAEFTFAQIILNLKKTFQFMDHLRRTRNWEKSHDRENPPGGYGSTVGLVSPGMIGTLVLKWLKNLDVTIQVYDIGLTEEKAESMGVKLCSLEELFRTSDVVSLHTAYRPETVGMITGDLIDSMKKGAVLINTARGGLIKEDEMIDVLTRRNDLSAVLDVVHPEPPNENNPLFDLPNVYLTPHIAGSLGNECRRMGQMAIDECRRWLKGESLRYQVTAEMLKTMA